MMVIVLLSSFIGVAFPLSSSWKINYSRLQSQRDFRINHFSAQFTDAIKECYGLDGFSTSPLSPEFSVVQGMIAKKQMISVIKKKTKIAQ